MKLSRILLFTGGLVVAILVTAFLHDRLTYTPGMISWRSGILSIGRVSFVVVWRP